ncbi:hypothetical protein [Helicobacter sp. T3_23-1056]
MDCHALRCNARNDDTMLDCHAQQVALARTIFTILKGKKAFYK